MISTSTCKGLLGFIVALTTSPPERVPMKFIMVNEPTPTLTPSFFTKKPSVKASGAA